MWKNFSPDVEALVVFQGPQTYITPSWYQTKEETGKVVPTWNYAVVHAYGGIRIIEDSNWLRAAVERLTNQQERARKRAWAVSDAPDEYVQAQLRAIVGIEIPVTRLIGKWKVSQNRVQADRESVIRGLHEDGGADSAAMADWIRRKTSK